jgi:hypothetical protein
VINLLTWIAIFAACAPLAHEHRLKSVALCQSQLKKCIWVDKNPTHDCLMSFNLLDQR